MLIKGKSESGNLSIDRLALTPALVTGREVNGAIFISVRSASHLNEVKNADFFPQSPKGLLHPNYLSVLRSVRLRSSFKIGIKIN